MEASLDDGITDDDTVYNDNAINNNNDQYENREIKGVCQNVGVCKNTLVPRKIGVQDYDSNNEDQSYFDKSNKDQRSIIL